MNDPILSQDFELPGGYRSADGRVHNRGSIRLINQRDRMIAFKLASPLFDSIANEANPAYSHYVDLLLLSRILVTLGDLPLTDQIRMEIVEEMTDVDLSYLQDRHDELTMRLKGSAGGTCPTCGQALASEGGQP